jgi:hypothetical protein
MMAKIYTKNAWVDEVLAGPERYNTLTNAGAAIDSNIQIVLNTGVSVAGSGVTAARMNNLEDGVDGLDDLVDGLVTDVSSAESAITSLQTSRDDGWLPVSATWTRTGNHTFTVSGDATAVYRKGVFVRYKDGGAFEYGVIASSSYSAPNTIVTLINNSDYAMAAGAITDTAISRSPMPAGFPTVFSFSPAWNSVTLGNGSSYGKWKTIDNFIRVNYGLILGSTTGFPAFPSAVNVAAIVTPVALGLTYAVIGQCIFRDTGTALYHGPAMYVGTAIYPFVSLASGSYDSPQEITQIIPHTWATTDELGIFCEYIF